MPLKKSTGNMYDWCSHVHSHLAGECPHKCSYCYVQRNPHGVSPRYKGEPRLIEPELNVNYGTGKTIFIEHMGDLFAGGIHPVFITKILEHCRKYPYNTYVFQTKNPERALQFLPLFPCRFMIGTTIETNLFYPDTNVPEPIDRVFWIKRFKDGGYKIFITIEPIMNFDVDIFSKWIIEIKPQFVNIGADSKGCNLPEPSAEKILKLIEILNENNITIKKKTNLKRILNRGRTNG